MPIRFHAPRIDYLDQGTAPEPPRFLQRVDLEARAPTRPLVFHVVRERTTLSALIQKLYEQPSNAIVTLTRELNPTVSEQLHPGQLLILSHPDGEQDPDQLQRMQAAQRQVEHARRSLDEPTQQATIDYFNLFDDLSGYGAAGIGLFATATGRKLDAVQKVLRDIEALHQKTFAQHGTIRTPEFYAQRRALFARLDTALAQLTLKYTGFADSAKVKAQLGISTKSIMHNWKEAGTAAGGIPGYVENYTRVAKYAKWMRGAGYVGVVLDGANFTSKIVEACTTGREGECEQTVYVDGSEFSGSTLGGMAGAGAAYGLCNLAFGFFSAGTSLLWCGIVAGGAGGLAGGATGGAIGKYFGTQLYETTRE